jgi:hypothetical protein
LNEVEIGRWLSDNKWMQHGTWVEPIRGPWSEADEDETPIEPSLLKSGKDANLLAILFEDCFTPNLSTGVIHNVTILYSKNENKFRKKDMRGGNLGHIVQKVVMRI